MEQDPPIVNNPLEGGEKNKEAVLEEMETMSPVTEVDPHLAQLRERAAQQKEDDVRLAEKKRNELLGGSMIKKALEKKDTGAESLDSGLELTMIEKHKKSTPGWWKKAMVTLFGAGAIASSQGAKAAEYGDTTLKKESVAAKFATTTETAPVFDHKKYEQFGISYIEKLESNDNTKDVFLIAIPEYKSYGDVFKVLKKSGLSPASTETMDNALVLNEDLFRKAGSVISLKETVDKLGNQSYNTLTWDKKGNAFHGESREAQIMKGNEKKGKKKGNESYDMGGSSFDSDYDRYFFIVESPKTTASYESGIASN